MIEREALIREISEAFQHRKMPTGRIIESAVDLNYHLEAQRVDTYIRKFRDVVDRSNNALAAFHYLTTEAALWILPKYMISIVRESNSDDFLIDLVVYELVSGAPGEHFDYKNGHGSSMRALATNREARAVTDFLSWVEDFRNDGIEREIEFALAFWRTSPSGG